MQQLLVYHRIVYSEEQQFRQKWIWILVLGIFLIETPLFSYLIVKQLIYHQPVGNKPMPDIALTIFSLVMLMLCIGLPYLFYKLKLITEVQEDGIMVRFSPFLRKKILFPEIKSYTVRTYNPIREYGGWGIRYGRKGTAYNVSGNRGVQLELINGKRILIGSQRPEEFVRAINAMMR
jgi:hypothetical protein